MQTRLSLGKAIQQAPECMAVVQLVALNEKKKKLLKGKGAVYK